MQDYTSVKAPRGPQLSCKSWQTEAPMRMLMNNLDPEVAEDPQNLIIYGGSGKAVRSWKCYHSIVKCLQELNADETLLVQSGKPVGIFRTHELAPRVLIANSLLVPAWANWEYFRKLEALGLMMFGQMTAGSWIYIGTQGILQGTFETFAACARRHFGGDLRGKLVVSAGLGGMGGAQPLAVTMNNGVFIAAEVDRHRIERRISSRYLDVLCVNIQTAIDLALKAKNDRRPLSIGVVANAVDLLRVLDRSDIVPDVLTDQTSAHDLLKGYVPVGLSFEDACELREKHPDEYLRRSKETVAEHVRLMLSLQKKGARTFEYGNNIRGQARLVGVENAFEIPGFVSEYVRPLFCEGRGPFRWVALSGAPEDIHNTDDVILREFPEDEILRRWITLARHHVKFQGLPARICWLGYGERARFGSVINHMVKKGDLKSPVVIGRDHLDSGSVASPYRETEGMKDGSDAIADWPILNALLNASSGATWVAVHHGGGVGIGYSIHAGMVLCCDGTELTDKRIELVLNNDPGLGIVRHADAGYESAIKTAEVQGIRLPMVK